MTRHVTTRLLTRLDATLSERDQAVLGSLAQVRAATSSQLERLHFFDVTTRQARKSLSSLVRRGLLVRLTRRVGGTGSGSSPYVYALDVAGQRLARPVDGRARKPWALGSTFLDHTLAVTEVYVRLNEAHRDRRLQVVGFLGEPGCWRTYPTSGGGRETLKPDAAVITRDGDFEDRWFLELDRGTESLPTIARKAAAYRRYYLSGLEQNHQGVFPRVLWLVPDNRRRAALTEVLSRQPAEAWALHIVALCDDVVGHVQLGAAQ